MEMLQKAGMLIEVHESLPSTQIELLERAKSRLCLLALKQNAGIGSRGNSWSGVEEGLYFSFCLSKKDLPEDLALQSVSIYFGFWFKEILRQWNTDVWLKWPNDIYVEKKKIGGVMVSIKGDLLVCGIGLNFLSADASFGALGTCLDRLEVLEKFFEILQKSISWKQTLNKYKIEFYKNIDFSFHHRDPVRGEYVVELKDAELCEDGALLVWGQKIYSLR